MYIVVDITNYGNGLYIGGVYKSKEKAERRCKWLQTHGEYAEYDENGEWNQADSWQVWWSKSRNITDLEVD